MRVRRPGFLLAGVLLAIGWLWGATHWPLQSLYGLLSSSDRVGNLALVQVVAAGNSPLRTAQVGQLHFEPFWGLLVAALSGFDPDRVLAIYPFLPLLACLLFALTLFFGLRAEGWSPWERVLVAAFATLVSSAPFEYAGTYRVPWAMTFLLKPNHALGFVLLPLLLGAFTRIETWKGRLGVGLLLHLLGWVFVIHMAFAATGLLIFAAWSLWARRAERRRDVLDALVVIGVNVVVVSPYLAMLLVGYPFLDASPRAMIPPFSAHLLEATLKQGPVFWLGLWGLRVAARRGDRLSRAFVAQVAAGYAVWAFVLVLSALQQARERDEIYYWVRLLTAAAAGIGAFDLASRAAASFAAPQRCAAVLALALPWSLPYWWDPLVMDSYAPGSLSPLPDRLRRPTDFIRSHTDPRAVLAGDRDYARYVAALGARRVSLALNFHVPSRYADRVRLEEDLVRGTTSAGSLALARELGISYLVATPRLLATTAFAPRRVELDARRDLERVFVWDGPERDFVAIYRIQGPRP